MPERAAYALFDRVADLTVARGGAARMRSNYARVRPELDDAALDALVRDGHAPLPALLLRGLPPAGPRPRRPRASACGSRATGRSREVIDGGGSVVALPRAPRQLGPRRRVGHDAPRPGDDRRRAAQARGGLRGVPRVPGVARHDDHPAHRRGQPVPGAARGRPAARHHPAARRPRPHRIAGSRSTSAGPPPGWRPARPRSRWPSGARCTRSRSATSAAAPAGGSSSPSTRAVAVPDERHDPRARHRDDAGSAPTSSAPPCASTPPTGTCSSGSSSTTSTRSRLRRPGGRRREGRDRLPLLVGRPGRGAVPRARPRRALHRAGPRRLGARPGRRRDPAARPTSPRAGGRCRCATTGPSRG